MDEFEVGQEGEAGEVDVHGLDGEVLGDLPDVLERVQLAGLQRRDFTVHVSETTHR